LANLLGSPTGHQAVFSVKMVTIWSPKNNQTQRS